MRIALRVSVRVLQPALEFALEVPNSNTANPRFPANTRLNALVRADSKVMLGDDGDRHGINHSGAALLIRPLNITTLHDCDSSILNRSPPYQVQGRL
ncbi:MAG: hypothetical protein ABIR27_07960 [Dokdonella sp.]